MRLEGKVAIVTGATKGIGRIIAATMAAEGAKVVALGRTVARGEVLVASIEAAGGEALFLPTDVGNEADIQRAVDAAVERFGALTTLVNNAAATDLIAKGDGVVTEISLEAWEQILRVGLTGPMLLSKYAIPHMIAAGGGSIVNISSDASVRPPAAMAAYAASKSGLNSLTRSIAVEYGAQHIRANTILTGMILPPQAVPLFEGDPVLAGKLRAGHLTRLGRREDIAAGVVYLSSDEAGFVTGTMLAIDGGAPIITTVPDKQEFFEGKA